MDPIKITRVLKEVPVEIEDEKGVTEKYRLREMTGKLRDQYMQEQQSRFKTNSAGIEEIQNLIDLQSSLIRRSLWDEAGTKLIKHEIIQEFPSEAQATLFIEARKLNGFTKEGQLEEKNA